MPRSDRAPSRSWRRTGTRFCSASSNYAPSVRRRPPRAKAPLAPAERRRGCGLFNGTNKGDPMSAMLADTRSDEATVVVEAPRAERKRVVIVGGGFAGLRAAHALRHADAE